MRRREYSILGRDNACACVLFGCVCARVFYLSGTASGTACCASGTASGTACCACVLVVCVRAWGLFVGLCVGLCAGARLCVGCVCRCKTVCRLCVSVQDCVSAVCRCKTVARSRKPHACDACHHGWTPPTATVSTAWSACEVAAVHSQATVHRHPP